MYMVDATLAKYSKETVDKTKRSSTRMTCPLLAKMYEIQGTTIARQVAQSV